MSNIVNTVKDKLAGANKSTAAATSAQSDNAEPTFSILPHPAKTNDPADLQPREGLRSGGGAMDAFNTPGPFIPSEEMKQNIPEPLSREELQARQASLNSDHYRPSN